jgi:succinate dehydrogenase / fumarate reductase iron-sulfur subunit
MKFRISRSFPQDHVDEFDLPFKPEEGYTILQALRFIQETIDPTLAFYNHSACSHGICGRCLIKVNGKLVLACVAHADEEDIMLEPRPGERIKDLLCR